MQIKAHYGILFPRYSFASWHSNSKITFWCRLVLLKIGKRECLSSFHFIFICFPSLFICVSIYWIHFKNKTAVFFRNRISLRIFSAQFCASPPEKCSQKITIQDAIGHIHSVLFYEIVSCHIHHFSTLGPVRRKAKTSQVPCWVCKCPSTKTIHVSASILLNALLQKINCYNSKSTVKKENNKRTRQRTKGTNQQMITKKGQQKEK